MGKCKMRISIDFMGLDDRVESHSIEVEAVLPEDGVNIIDNVEKTVLKLNKDAIRQAVSIYLEELSKKKPKSSKEIEEVLFKRMLLNTESTEK